MLQLKVRAALKYQRFNPLYHDVLIRDGNINENLLSVGNILPESDIGFEVESDHELESAANPARVHRHAANEFLVVEHENLLELVLLKDKKIKHSLLMKSVKDWHFQKYFSKESSRILFLVNIF